MTGEDIRRFLTEPPDDPQEFFAWQCWDLALDAFQARVLWSHDWDDGAADEPWWIPLELYLMVARAVEQVGQLDRGRREWVGRLLEHQALQLEVWVREARPGAVPVLAPTGRVWTNPALGGAARMNTGDEAA